MEGGLDDIAGFASVGFNSTLVQHCSVRTWVAREKQRWDITPVAEPVEQRYPGSMAVCATPPGCVSRCETHQMNLWPSRRLPTRPQRMFTVTTFESPCSFACCYASAVLRSIVTGQGRFFFNCRLMLPHHFKQRCGRLMLPHHFRAVSLCNFTAPATPVR